MSLHSFTKAAKHWGFKTIANILQMFDILKIFFWKKKILVFGFYFYFSLFLGVQQSISQQWLDAETLVDEVKECQMAPLGHNELTIPYSDGKVYAKTTPTMHLTHIPQCTIQNRNVHISILNDALWDMEHVHWGICEIGLLVCSSLIEPPVHRHQWHLPSKIQWDRQQFSSLTENFNYLINTEKTQLHIFIPL